MQKLTSGTGETALELVVGRRAYRRERAAGPRSMPSRSTAPSARLTALPPEHRLTPVACRRRWPTHDTPSAAGSSAFATVGTPERRPGRAVPHLAGGRCPCRDPRSSRRPRQKTLNSRRRRRSPCRCCLGVAVVGIVDRVRCGPLGPVQSRCGAWPPAPRRPFRAGQRSAPIASRRNASREDLAIEPHYVSSTDRLRRCALDATPRVVAMRAAPSATVQHGRRPPSETGVPSTARRRSAHHLLIRARAATSTPRRANPM